MQRDGRGLAAAALAHQAQRLALLDGEVDAVDGAHMAHGALQEARVMGKNFCRPRTSSSGGGSSVAASLMRASASS